MAISISDVSNGKRRVDDVGDPKNYRHLKQYSRFYGSRVASGLMVIVISVPLVTSILDFFSPRKHNGREDKRKNDR